MKDRDKLYDLVESDETGSIRYFFISPGEPDIIKAIAYDYVQDLLGSPLYNLGFGDYDPTTDQIDDSSNSNNGDMYRVFHTVLNTIPKFFESNPNAMLVVQGSDHSQDFSKKCRQTCTKQCGNTCKKLHRRIKIYSYFIQKNYEKLSIDYRFWGAFRSPRGIILHDDYDVGAEYDLLFCKKK